MMKMCLVIVALGIGALCSGSNPVKMSMALLIISGAAFLRMAWKAGLSWFPILFFLLFMGGILLMFMILSAILPNQNWGEQKFAAFPGFLVVMLLYNLGTEQKMSMTSSQMKSFLSTSNNMIFLTLALMIYFFSSISMVSKEEAPMREVYC